MREVPICVLATASPGGEPWPSPVFFNYDGSLRIVWESAREARHSQLIRSNPKAGIVIANTDPEATDDALYLECLAHEVDGEDVADALEVFLHGPHKQQGRIAHRLEDYFGDEPLRLYVAIPQRAYVPVVTKDEEGRRIDSRKEIEIEDLKG